MPDERLIRDARITAGNLLAASATGGVQMCPHSARNLSAILQRLADAAESGGSASAEREAIVSMLQQEADRAGGTHAEEMALGRSRRTNALCAGAVSAALETMAHRVEERT